MQQNLIMAAEVNRTKITFTKRKMTAYGGFALVASFFERIRFAQMIEKIVPISECSPNGIGIYGKTIAFMAMIFAGAERFSHLIYLGNKEVLAKIFGVRRLPDAATTITRMFNKLPSLKAANTISCNVWTYLCQLIPWHSIKEDWLTFDSTVLLRYGEQKGDTTRSNTAGQATAPCLPFLIKASM